MIAESFQLGVARWMEQCFTPEIIADKLERSDRFIEESLELVQATDYSAERAHALVDYVFNRAVGEPFQEVGGVMVTLAALCNTQQLDMDKAAGTELERVWTKIDAIRAKQTAKPVGSAFPIPTTFNSCEICDNPELCAAGKTPCDLSGEFVGRTVPAETANRLFNAANWAAFDRVLTMINGLDIRDDETADQMRRRIYGLVHDMRPEEDIEQFEDDDGTSHDQ